MTNDDHPAVSATPRPAGHALSKFSSPDEWLDMKFRPKSATRPVTEPLAIDGANL